METSSDDTEAVMPDSLESPGPFIRKISIDGFRRLDSVDLELRSLNVLIGANGCGKSSFLDVFDLLKHAAGGDLSSRLRQMGGLSANITNLSQVASGKLTSIKVDSQLEPEEAIHFRFAASPRGISYEIPYELLVRLPESPQQNVIIAKSQGRIDRVDASPWEEKASRFLVDDNELILSSATTRSSTALRFRRALESIACYRSIDTGPKSQIRLPQEMLDARNPGEDGEYLVSCLYTLRETEPLRFEAIEDTLRAAFPSFEKLSFPPVAAGTLAMTWTDSKVAKPLYTHQLSDGTLRFLWLITLLQSPEVPAVLLIDEPEISLHPQLIVLFADLLRAASRRTQIIVATHSDRLVGSLDPDEVVIADAGNDGVTRMQRGSQLDLSSWLRDYSLNDLWQMGILGGRP